MTDAVLREKIRKQIGLKIGDIQGEMTQLNRQVKQRMDAADGSAQSNMPAVLDEETKNVAAGFELSPGPAALQTEVANPPVRPIDAKYGEF